MSTPGAITQPAYILSIPNELLNAIIDLSWDATTLFNCSLVCKRFTPRYQERIFHFITLDWNTEARGTATRLDNTFKKSPHLTQYVRHLHVYVNGPPRCLYFQPLFEAEKEDRHGWMLSPECKATSAVLSQLSGLQTLWLGCDILNLILQWEWCPQELQVALQTVFEKGTVHQLWLHSIQGFPLRYFADAFQSLTHLYLNSSTTSAERRIAGFSPSDSSSISMVPFQPSRLKSLTITRLNPQLWDFIPSLIPPESGIDLSDLRELAIHPFGDFGVNGADWWHGIVRLVQRVSHCLTELWIYPITESDLPEVSNMSRQGQHPRPLAFSRLGHLPQLQTLNIHIGKNLGDPDPGLPLQPVSYRWFVDLLSTIHEHQLPWLATINLIYKLDARDTTIFFDEALWQKLDVVLSHPALRSAKQVNILAALRCSGCVQARLEPLTKLIRQSMRRAHGRGVLRVAVGPTRDVGGYDPPLAWKPATWFV